VFLYQRREAVAGEHLQRAFPTRWRCSSRPRGRASLPGRVEEEPFSMAGKPLTSAVRNDERVEESSDLVLSTWQLGFN
jgi:hypothetical protein